MDDRNTRYRAMVAGRKACKCFSGLVNASALRFDSDEIGPWTRWLGDLDARVLVVGQDWGDEHAFEKQKDLDSPNSATNRMLRELLASVGVPVPDVGVAAGPSGVFLTNAVLCFKDQGCQAPVREEWFQACGPRFLRPQIELVNPRVVICLGERAYGAVLSAYDLPAHPNWRRAVEGPGVMLAGGPVAVAVYHCGQRILNTHRKRDAQFEDWKRVAAVLRDMPTA
jgi:uracil-DNA glycosylase family 4